MPKTRLAAASLFLALLLAACAGPSKFGRVEETLSQDVGVLTYDQAVDRWGPPTALDRGQSHFTAYWLKPATIADEKLWLTFDNQRQVLRSYRYLQRPFE